MIKKIIKKSYHIFPKKLQYKIHDKYAPKYKEYLLTKSIVKKKKIIKTLKKYDVISFDIFDTLLTRKVYNPDDVFKIIGQKLGIEDFLTKRKHAEKKAIEYYKHDVNIDEIYIIYSKEFNESNEYCNSIKELEKSIEISLIYPRTDMLEIFNKLKNKKTIILTSDMYLDKNTIVKMLEKCGYFGYSDFFLSNEVRARKDTGDIWQIVKNKYNKKIIHVGDNLNSDVLLPKKYNVDTFKIYSGREMFEKTTIYKFVAEKLQNLSINESIFYGLIVNKKMFNSPFSSLKIDELEKVGYTLYAPLINCFMEFICNETTSEDKLLFLSREGFNLEKLYYDYCKINGYKVNNSAYFLTSRKATKSALLSNEDEIKTTLDDYFKGDIKSFYKQIFGIEYKEKNFKIELPNDKDKVIDTLKKYKKDIKKQGQIEKNNYLKYINNVSSIDELKNSYLIDLGYSGSIQFNLSKLLNINLKGLYLLSSEKIKKYKRDSILKFKFNSTNNDMHLSVYHYSLLLEYFLTAPFGQLLSFDQNGKPIYNDEKLDKRKKEIISKIYLQCLEYMNDIYDIKQLIDISINDWDIVFIFTSFIENNIISKKVKNIFEYYDEHSFNSKYNIFKRISRY